MFTKQEIMETAMRQSADDINCEMKERAGAFLLLCVV